MTRIGVVGAGRVGAVLAEALRSAGHEISAVAGESDASRMRIETLLPGVHVDKPTAVSRACDLLLLTVPDDMLANVVTMLAASGAIRPGQRVVHTSGKHGVAVLEPAVRAGAQVLAMHPAMTFTGTDVDLARLPGCVFGVTAGAGTEGLARSLVAQAMDLLRASGADDPAGTLRPLLTAALDNALSYGDAALTGPIVRGDVETVRAHLADIAATAPATLDAYVAMARATANRAVLDGRLLPIRAAKLIGVLNDALAGAAAVRPT